MPMDPAGLYLILKPAHIGLVGTSVALFGLRGAARLAGAAWPLARGWRLTAIGIDTLLLASGVGLWRLLGLHPGLQPWLGVKLGLLVVYVVLGSLALRRAGTPARRAAAYVAALACVATMASIALTHDPRGWLTWI